MIPIGDREFERLTSHLKSNFGINLTAKRTLIEGRLTNYLTQRGYDDYGAFLEMVMADPSGQEMSALLDRLTTNYSFFMREMEHFAFFKDTILPELTQTIRDHDMRIWSAGCSTGQEPYNIAMMINDYLGEQKPRWDSKVLATDISMKALTIAQSGTYDAESMEKVPADWRYQYFDKMPNGSFQVKQSLKNEVIFRRFNLMETHFPFKKPFHVIFCRNVMIYFDKPTKAALIDRFTRALHVGGYLIVGQSESVDRDGTSALQSCIPSVYRRVR